VREKDSGTGRLGERLAARHLRKNGYRILARNFRTKSGEIDIVAHEGGELCFVEVKTRTSLEFGDGEDFVDRHKMRQIASVADDYVLKHRLDDMSQRFDCVFVMLDRKARRGILGRLLGPKAKIEVMKDAFTRDDISR
jgi:putative endonuclease